jgi:2-oxoglutarate ferredoxin oxidoreductase subunit beta
MSELKSKMPLPPSFKLPPKVGKIIGGGENGVSAKDFKSDQDVRWCPGCGDYSILAQTQRIMPDLGVARENMVFISGIGCSSRFPYYMNTYGMHSIHGRAPSFASGLKASRPELDVWIITGDGDSLSIGGNHLIHLVRRNLDCQILLFNNQIYGLTKGQYSPTSEVGKQTKSSPYGSLDHPFNPSSLVLGADATYVARTMDRDPKHLQSMLKRAHGHKGTSFVEVYQNCNIFNDGAFFEFTETATKPQRTIFIEHGKPMIFDNGKKGIKLEGFSLKVVNLEDGSASADDCLVYDETSRELAFIVARMSWDNEMPRPFGVFYREDRPTYDAQVREQIAEVIAQKGKGSLEKLLNSGDTWTID